jgi:hypothetical protein
LHSSLTKWPLMARAEGQEGRQQLRSWFYKGRTSLDSCSDRSPSVHQPRRIQWILFCKWWICSQSIPVVIFFIMFAGSFFLFLV